MRMQLGHRQELHKYAPQRTFRRRTNLQISDISLSESASYSACVTSAWPGRRVDGGLTLCPNVLLRRD